MASASAGAVGQSIVQYINSRLRVTPNGAPDAAKQDRSNLNGYEAVATLLSPVKYDCDSPGDGVKMR